MDLLLKSREVYLLLILEHWAAHREYRNAQINQQSKRIQTQQHCLYKPASSKQEIFRNNPEAIVHEKRAMQDHQGGLP
jgi:hypothetical protein